MTVMLEKAEAGARSCDLQGVRGVIQIVDGTARKAGGWHRGMMWDSALEGCKDAGG